MKRIFIIIAILACFFQIQARTMEIVYSNDSVSIRIDSEPVDIINSHKFIELSIDSISITENPKLNNITLHKLMIGGVDVASFNLKQSIPPQKIEKPFSIQNGDKLSFYRNKNLLREISFATPKLDPSEVKKNIYFNPCYAEKNQFVLQSETDTVIYLLINPQRFTVESISLIDTEGNKIGGINYNLNNNNDTVKIPVTLKNAESLTKAHAVITVNEVEIEFDGESEIIVKKQGWGGNMPIIWGVIGVIIVAILGSYYYSRKKCKNIDPECKNEDSEGTEQATGNEDNDGNGTNDNVIISVINDLDDSLDKVNLKDPKALEDIIKNHEVKIEELNKTIGELETKLYDAQSKESEAYGTIDKLRALINNLQNTVNSLQNLKNENDKLTKENVELLKIRDTVNYVREKNRKCVVEIQKMKDTAKDKDKLIQTLSVNLESAERSKASKDKQIKDLNAEKDRLNQYLKDEKQASEDLHQKIKGFSKQTHYLYLIDEALCNIEKMLPIAFGNVTDETLRRKLIDPIVIGTPGLDENGMESYKIMWREEVYDNQVKFFGKNVLQLTDGEVMEQLREKFIENLALRDSFNKLARLYLFSNVGWLNVKLVETGFDVDAIQTLFIDLKNLFNRFGVEIAYPHLFVDAFDEIKHRDSHRCDIFSIFSPNHEIDAMIHTKEGECLIVDLVRIGLPKSKTVTRRIPMVSLPNF